jgi:hypothetical protein
MPTHARSAPFEVHVSVTSAVLVSSAHAAVPGATKLVKVGPAGVVSVGSGLGVGVGDGLGVTLADGDGEADAVGDGELVAVGSEDGPGENGPRLVRSAAITENTSSTSRAIASPMATRVAALLWEGP